MFFNFSVILFVFSSLLHSFTFNTKVHKKYSIIGIDVSHHQQNINWKNVATDESPKVSFCYIKATEGATLVDKRFSENWDESREAGLHRGAYHFYNPKVNVKKQARNFIKTVKLSDGDLPPVLDFEHENEDLTVLQTRKNIKLWLQLVEQHYKTKPIIYTNTFIYNKYIKGYFKGHTLWIADYNTNNIKNEISNPKLKFWQYSEKGRVAGIKGHVDFNAFIGREEDFEKQKI